MTDGTLEKVRKEIERLQNELIQEKEKVLCEDSEGECATKGVDNSLEGIIEAAILWGKYYYAKNDIPREELNQAINYYCSILKKVIL